MDSVDIRMLAPIICIWLFNNCCIGLVDTCQASIRYTCISTYVCASTFCLYLSVQLLHIGFGFFLNTHTPTHTHTHTHTNVCTQYIQERLMLLFWRFILFAAIAIKNPFIHKYNTWPHTYTYARIHKIATQHMLVGWFSYIGVNIL